MLCAEHKSNQQSATADSVTRADGPFVCPYCREEVSLRKSLVRTCHFAHRALSVCSHSAGETEEHRRCKKAICEALLKEPGVTKVALERSLMSVRPDVSAYVNGVPVAFEVQLSTLSLETIAQRTAEYARKGVYVLWLAQWTPYLDAERYSPRLWEKWVHACYFGRVYYWTEGLSVIPYRFEPHFREGGSPYAEPGQRDFKRQSKRYRTPVRGKTLDLITDFLPKDRDAWESPVLKIAPSKLYMDRNPGFLN